ncbi:Aspartate aminotransferase [Raoultella terrigena]|uniref:Aminotransferase n=1 Tax=Raoultella terrigena TaxID=577 RepID=A0A4U9D9R0_RAOTE|nr:Aspartate aminotransferase [Raoultella terrigena]
MKKAEQYLLENETTKNYLGIDGIPEFGQCTQELLSVKEAHSSATGVPVPPRPLVVPVPCAFAADFLAKNTDVKRVWVSNPSWPNHKSVFNSAASRFASTPTTMRLAARSTLPACWQASMKLRRVTLFCSTAAATNPTGIDPTLEQWQQLAQLSVDKGWLPLFDFAYQGFARGLEEDAEGLRAFAALHKELLVASSYSKNFGLYNERVGACTLVASDSDTVDRAFSQMKSAIRANYSNPPAHGAAFVATILSNDALRAIWEQELTDMRQRIQRMRLLFVNTLQEKGATATSPSSLSKTACSRLAA